MPLLTVACGDPRDTAPAASGEAGSTPTAGEASDGGTDPATSSDVTVGDSSAEASSDDGPGSDSGEVPGGCPPVDVCTAWNERASCNEDAGAITWTTVACGDGEGCYLGACTPTACADECYLDESKDGRSCELFDVGTGDWVDNDAGDLHGRARAFERWLRKDTASLFYDGLVSAKYTDAGLGALDSVYVGDTALHTGLYLAAESHRLATTGSFRARKNVRTMVEAFHLWFNVSGDPGMLANIAAPAGDGDLRQYTEWDCDAFDRFCDVEYAGQRWDYIGDPSRDMYMGPLIGLTTAYRALGPFDEDLRAQIRHDLFATAWELHELRTIDIAFELNGLELPPAPYQTRFVIPESGQQIDGTYVVTFDTGDVESGTILGGQEFLPNPAQLLRQNPALAWLPDIPRSSSALMVAATIRGALDVTEGYEEFEPQRSELEAFYYGNTDEWGNIHDWLELASHWSHDKECGEAYFGVNIAMIPMFVLATLEHDPAVRAFALDAVFDDALWAEVATHENAFFSLAYAATRDGADPAIGTDAGDALASFGAPPRVREPVDLSDDPAYQDLEPGCSDQLEHSQAVDVGDRPAQYFAWHSNPWALRDAGDPRQTYPGHDFLLAYWLGREHDFIDEDTAGRCLRWRD